MYNEQCYREMSIILDFLKNDSQQPHQVIPNLKLSEGKCHLKKNSLGNYQYAYFLVSNDNGRLVQSLVHSSETNPTTDLRLKEQRQKGSVFHYSRAIDFMQDNAKFSIPHVQKQEFSLIESMEELFEVFQMVY